MCVFSFETEPCVEMKQDTLGILARACLLLLSIKVCSIFIYNGVQSRFRVAVLVSLPPDSQSRSQDNVCSSTLLKKKKSIRAR